MSKTEWVPTSSVLDVITDKNWSWIANNRCKYVELRIDTRDGHCVIRDRHGKPITLDDLRYQYTPCPTNREAE